MGGRDGDRPKAEHGSDVRGIRPCGGCRARDVLGPAAPQACADIQCRSSLTPPVPPAAFFMSGDPRRARALPVRRLVVSGCTLWTGLAREGKSSRRHPVRHGQSQSLRAGRRGWLPGRIVLDHHAACDPGALGSAQADGLAHLEGGSVGSAAGAGRLRRDRFTRDRGELAFGTGRHGRRNHDCDGETSSQSGTSKVTHTNTIAKNAAIRKTRECH